MRSSTRWTIRRICDVYEEKLILADQAELSIARDADELEVRKQWSDRKRRHESAVTEPGFDECVIGHIDRRGRLDRVDDGFGRMSADPLEPSVHVSWLHPMMDG